MFVANLVELLETYRIHHPAEMLADECIAFARRQPSCLQRNCFDDGHFTVSAWISNLSGDQCLLAHHRKLDKWLQLGGHVESDDSPIHVALREVKEESSLDVSRLTLDIFDVDVHNIPAHGSEPPHRHYDIRFLFDADHTETLRTTDETNELRWVQIDLIEEFTIEESILRMVRKHREFFTRR